MMVVADEPIDEHADRFAHLMEQDRIDGKPIFDPTDARQSERLAEIRVELRLNAPAREAPGNAPTDPAPA
jgi:hypothetical protein